MSENPPDVDVSFDGAVATVEMRRPPHNFFDIPLIRQLADAFEALEADRRCHAIVLAAQGTSFCAGADFSKRDATPPQRSPRGVNPIYDEALRLFACTKPVVAAVQGPAVGGGLGVALVADFRVSCAEARFSANFNRLGFHPGFGLSATLPRLVGVQQAALLFYTGRRIGGEEALRIGLVDQLVPQDQVRSAAQALAREIAISAPLAVQATRVTLRQGLVEQIRIAVARESTEQNAQFKTADFKEGVAAMAARREPQFKGE
ncbi:MAG: enoyl-CoA hydratase/isomerase family protein [Burkholderiales bacterium]|nr:enoyl-CoA hydratase/isomerase family protein [Burkholderiales bacterium]